MTTPKRWQEIDRIFAAALEREPGARAVFLDEACGGDEQLRQEVESLLACDRPESLVGGHADQEATRLLVKQTGELTTNRRSGKERPGGEPEQRRAWLERGLNEPGLS